MRTSLLHRKILHRALLLGALLGLMIGPARAQDALTDNPGYVNPNTIESWFEARPNIEINLQGALLRMVAQAADDSEPELSGLLSRIEGIYVRGYTDSTITARRDRSGEISRLTDRLQGEGWETVVRIRDEGDDVNVSLRMTDEAIAGLLVMVNDAEGEHIFINIVGDIRPEELGRIGRGLNIDPLKNLPATSNAND